MKRKITILVALCFVFLNLTLALLPSASFAQAPASTPLPLPTIDPTGAPAPAPVPRVTTPPPNRTNFDQTMFRLQKVAAEVLPTWFREAEKYILEYFFVLIGILAGFVFAGSFLYFGWNNVLQNNAAFLQWLIPALFFSLLIPFCGDLDGDGKMSDPVEYVRYFGQLLAYGPPGTVPGLDNPNPLPGLVANQEKYYNEAYKRFVEGTFTVVVKEGETPVTIPGPEGVEKRLFVLYQGGYKLDQIKETVDPNSWSMTTLFEMVNLSRSVMEIANIFVLVLQGIFGSALRILFPFCILFSIDPNMRKRMLGNYMWFLAAACLVLPIVTQVMRFLVFGIMNFVLYSQSPDAYFLYDASTMSIVQQQDPTLMIWLFTVVSVILALVLGIGTPSLSYAVTQMNLYQWLTGAVSGGFTMLTSVALSYVTSAVGAALGQELDFKRAGVNRDVSDMGTMNQYRGSRHRTQGEFNSTQAIAQGDYTVGQVGAEGHLVTGRMGSSASFIAGAGTTLVDLDEKRQRAFLSGAVGMSKADIDSFKQLDGLDAEQMKMAIEANPAMKDIWAKKAETVPFIGSVAGGIINAGDNLTNGKLGNSYVGSSGLEALTKLGTDKNGKFSSELFTENMYSKMATTPDGLKALDKMGLSPEKIGRTIEGNGAFGFPQGGHSPNVASFVGGGNSGMSKTQRQSYAALQKLARQDPNFMPTLIRESKKRGINPDHMLNMVAIESTFNKNADNGLGYIGLGQVGRAERRSIGWSGNDATDMARIKNMSASQQLEQLVFPFVDKKFQGATSGITMDKLYAGWGSGHYSNNPNYVHMADGGKRNQAYQNNPAWDVNKDGMVQQWEFGPAAQNKLGAGKHFSINDGNIGNFNAGDFRPVVRPNMSGNQNGANIPQVISRQGSYDLTVQPRQLPNPQAEKMYVNAQDSLNKLGKTERETMTPIYSKQVELEKRRGTIIDETIQTKQVIQAQTNSDVAISENSAEGRIQILRQQRNMQDTISDTNFNYETAQNQIRFGTQMQAAGIRQDTGNQISEMDKATGLDQSAARFQQDIIDAKARAGASIINSVGTALAHQTEEAFEKINNQRF